MDPLLKLEDITAELRGRRIAVIWENKWWTAEVVTVDLRERKVTVMYLTGGFPSISWADWPHDSPRPFFLP
jgi:hypothetical protein